MFVCRKLIRSLSLSCLDVDKVLAEKELEARRKVLEERRLREEARLAKTSHNPTA